MATKRQPVERSDEIEKFMRRWYQATVDGDLDTIAEAISDDPGVTFVGTDADEWWEGKEKCVAMYRTQIAEADSEVSSSICGPASSRVSNRARSAGATTIQL